VPAGSAVVGLNLRAGFAPSGLRPGDRVGLVLTPPAGSAPPQPSAGGSLLVPEARVYDVSATPDGQGQIVSVVVDTASAPVLAAQGARGTVSVIVLGGPG
jgi:hypothetical protein